MVSGAVKFNHPLAAARECPVVWPLAKYHFIIIAAQRYLQGHELAVTIDIVTNRIGSIMAASVSPFVCLDEPPNIYKIKIVLGDSPDVLHTYDESTEHYWKYKSPGSTHLSGKVFANIYRN